jgi:hypothetical protein
MTHPRKQHENQELRRSVPPGTGKYYDWPTTFCVGLNEVAVYDNAVGCLQIDDGFRMRVQD